ncbi:hypothetical protein V6N13_107347 [Hibiscus sabdariffa]
MAAAVFIGSLLLVLLASIILFPTLCFSRSDAESLLEFKKSLKNGDSKLNNWIPRSSPCPKKWIGVMCHGKAITGLHLTNLGLTGSIDVKALTPLHSLRTISLVNNRFTGPIPEFNKLGALKAIYLSNNQFTGEIPDDYFDSMGSLKKVWLNDNNFTGKIPSSLMQLPLLMELHLEGNQFSGKIPDLMYPNVLKSLNLTSNKLEGDIPKSFSKFNASTFDRNVELCGKQFRSHCIIHPTLDKSASPSTVSIIIISVSVVVVFFFVIAILVSTTHDEEHDLRSINSSGDSFRHVHNVADSTRSKSVESSWKYSLSLNIKRGLSHRVNKNKTNDLIMVNAEKVAFGLEDLMKASVEMLENGVLGSAYKAMMENGTVVVVKKTREMNKLGKEKFGIEMKRFGEFKHPNVLVPLAFQFRKEEKLIVSEYMPCGSLLYALHGDRGVFHAKLNWQNRLKIIKGIAEGLGYIHTQLATYVVPHGNLKTSNVLLSETYDPLLSDYGFYPFVDSDTAAQGLFAYRSPECLQNQQHVSPKSDVYCFGVVILEVMTGKYPSQYLNGEDGGIDVVQWAQSSISENHVEELIDPEILSSGSINQMVKIIKIGVTCTKSDPDQRLNLSDVISKIQEVN